MISKTKWNNEERITVNKYLDLFNEKLQYNAWKSDDSFSFSEEDKDIIESLSRLCIAEIELKRNDNSSKEFDELFISLNQTIKDVVAKVDIPTYMFISEHIARTKSRIRSYKGIIEKKHKEKYNHLELEVDWKKSPYTIILGIIKIEGNDIEDLLDHYFIDSNTCFIIQSHSACFFTTEFLKSFPNKYMSSHQRVSINYADLIINEVKDDNFIYRIGGNGGNLTTAFQVFMQKNQFDSLNEIISSVLSNKN